MEKKKKTALEKKFAYAKTMGDIERALRYLYENLENEDYDEIVKKVKPIFKKKYKKDIYIDAMMWFQTCFRKEKISLDAFLKRLPYYRNYEEAYGREALYMFFFPTGFALSDLHKHYLRELQLVYEGKSNVAYFTVSMPPQHGKTEGMMLLAWKIALTGLDVTYATYSEPHCKKLVNRFRAGCRRYTQFQKSILEEESDYGLAQTEMRQKPKANLVINMKHGYMIVVGAIGGSLPGQGGFVVADDLEKGDEDSRYGSIHDKTIGNFKSQVESRSRSNYPIMVVHTRHSEDDVIGSLIGSLEKANMKDMYTHLNYKAIILTQEDKEGDYFNREIGEAIWEPNVSAARLMARKASMEGHGGIFMAQYQGMPVAFEGMFLKGENIRFYEEVPNFKRVYGFFDGSSAETKELDPSCFIMCGMLETGELYVLPRVQWGRYSFRNQHVGLQRICKESGVKKVFTEKRDII